MASVREVQNDLPVLVERQRRVPAGAQHEVVRALIGAGKPRLLDAERFTQAPLEPVAGDRVPDAAADREPQSWMIELVGPGPQGDRSGGLAQACVEHCAVVAIERKTAPSPESQAAWDRSLRIVRWHDGV